MSINQSRIASKRQSNIKILPTTLPAFLLMKESSTKEARAMTDRLKLECCHADTCLPCYWSGHNLPYIQIPVYNGMPLAELKRDLIAELNECVQGDDTDFLQDWRAEYDKEKADAWYASAEAAIGDIEPADKELAEKDGLFLELEEQADDDSESVYAYFVFKEVE